MAEHLMLADDIGFDALTEKRLKKW